MKKIIVFVSQKGGVGKSTFARAVAVVFKKAGYSVKVADMDTQQTTCVDWHKRRKSNAVEPLLDHIVSCRTVEEALADQEDYDIVILDGAPRGSRLTLEICALADLVVQASGAGRDDLDPAVLLFHELAAKGIDKSKMYLALCRVGTKAEEAGASDYIQRGGYNTVAGALFEKACYRQAQNEGKTILETSFKTANQSGAVVIQNLMNIFFDTTK
ncbi:ParA family protein [Desulfotalea psychrophila]|uniref:Related to plasmid partition protein ParA n=1 Tax=Desulfotalea psychrophila (strain LSv54 / DSM 12343) TaxID=177439 RepID=Q6AII0_DESPS|nr:ParA family protein [Desulfotalea psychrophila]CAG37867.1 related to plasmid partition protein ParA [Desulfotalea psychrophila LSv54]